MYGKFEDYAITSFLRNGKAARRERLMLRLVKITAAIYFTIGTAVLISWAVI